MGSEVETTAYTREQRQRYREKVQQNLDIFERMLRQHSFEFDRPMTGMEIELNLVDQNHDPHFANEEVLSQIADPGFVTELAKYNIELNVPPRPLPGDAALRLEDELRSSLNAADAAARQVGSRLVTIGILPTIMPEHYDQEWISDDNRYAALNDSIFTARGEDVRIDIRGSGGERVSMYADSIAPESACTSVQLHLQVEPHSFADHWNAAQAIAPVQVALAANSPFLFGKRLHAETRIELFKQATDTRPIELKNQGVRPRVFFGERWITSIFDLFEENVRYFPALLAESTSEDPLAKLEAGEAPELAELRLHNGTVYRWNRPIYDIVEGRPHLRVENRVLPAGPTIADTMANAAFYYGAIRQLAQTERPVWTSMSFSACTQNFEVGSRDGMQARLYWPGLGEVGVDELVLRKLLPVAADGLADWGVSGEVIDRYLGIMEARCQATVNGATWQSEAVRRLEDAGHDRLQALRIMMGEYLDRMSSNDPVHTWSQV